MKRYQRGLKGKAPSGDGWKLQTLVADLDGKSWQLFFNTGYEDLVCMKLITERDVSKANYYLTYSQKLGRLWRSKDAGVLEYRHPYLYEFLENYLEKFLQESIREEKTGQGDIL